MPIVRPQRLLPADGNLVSAPALSPAGIVVPGVQGLNLPAPVAVAPGFIATTAASSNIIDVSGYNTFSWFVAADVANAFTVSIAIVDPQGSTTEILTVPSGVAAVGVGVNMSINFGSNAGVLQNTAFYFIRLKVIRNVAATAFNLTLVSALTCSWS